MAWRSSLLMGHLHGRYERRCYSDRRLFLPAVAVVSDGVDTRCHRQSTVRLGSLMNIHLSAGPLVSLLAGILILVMPRLLNYIVAIYLILIGLIGLFGLGWLHVA